MQKWEHLQVYVYHDQFAVTSSQGPYLKSEDFQAIDPKGREEKDGKGLYWKSGMGKTRFLLLLLDQLGAQGWDVVGNINSGNFSDIFLLLKRPIE